MFLQIFSIKKLIAQIKEVLSNVNAAINMNMKFDWQAWVSGSIKPISE
jgi:hypothetical protein